MLKVLAALLIICVALLIWSFPAEPKDRFPFFKAPQIGCKVTGKTRGLNPRLMARLRRMACALGPVRVVSGCRRKSLINSMHLYRNGCKAADVLIRGKSCRQIRRYWNRTGGGGTGCYRRSFPHVDVGPTRQWNR